MANIIRNEDGIATHVEYETAEGRAKFPARMPVHVMPGEDRETAARRVLLIAEASEGHLEPGETGPNPLVSEYASYWYSINYGRTNSRRVSGSTAKGARVLVEKHILPVIGHVRMDDLTEEHVASVMREASWMAPWP